MATYSGTAGSVVYIAGGTQLLSDVYEWSLDFSMSPPEATAFGETVDSFVSSVRTATGSFNSNLAVNGTGQNFYTFQRLAEGTTIRLKLYEDSGKFFDIPTCVVTGSSPSVSIKGRNELTTSFQTTSAVTYN